MILEYKKCTTIPSDTINFLDFQTASVRTFSFLKYNQPEHGSCCHVSGAGVWLDGAVGEGGVEETRQGGGQEDVKRDGVQKGGREEGRKLGSQEEIRKRGSYGVG